MVEKLTNQVEATVELNPEIETGNRERIAEQLAERVEKSKEKNTAQETESAMHEAVEQAVGREVDKPLGLSEKESVEKPVVSTKKVRQESYNRIMQETREQMSPASRSFSKVIHNPAVEKASEVVGKTVARPNAILSGSISACLAVLIVYLVSRHYGYPLSGSETVIAFAAGWLLGILYDFFKKMITGKD